MAESFNNPAANSPKGGVIGGAQGPESLDASKTGVVGGVNSAANAVAGGAVASSQSSSGGSGSDAPAVAAEAFALSANVQDAGASAGSGDGANASAADDLGRKQLMAGVNGDGANVITGDDGNNVLVGTAGRDILIAGVGADTLTGGGGADAFVFRAGDSTRAATDLITDFRSGVGGDQIDVTGLRFLIGQNGAVDLNWGGTKPTAYGVWYGVSDGVTKVYVDTDNNPDTAEAVISLSGTYTLSASDFMGVKQSGPTVQRGESNQAATITGKTGDTLTETDSVLSTSGHLEAFDPDSSAAFVVRSNVNGNNAYGKFNITAGGDWTYTTNTAQNQFQAGKTYTDAVTVTTADGTKQVITVTIVGTNDAAVITGDISAKLVETDSALSASGKLKSTDIDSATGFVAQTGIKGEYGSFSIDSRGNWSYQAGANNALNAGQTVTDSFTVKAVDGTPQVVTMSLVGTNDAPVFGAPTVTALTEDSGVDSAGNLVAKGSISIADADQGEAAFKAQVLAGALGSLAMEADGHYTYTVDNAKVQSLAEGAKQTETFTVRSADGTTKEVSFTVTGTNDAPVIDDTTTATGAVTEDGPLTVTGQIVAPDADLGAVLSYSGSTKTELGSFEIDEETGAWTYTLADHQELSAKDSIQEKFTVKVTDDQGAEATQEVTVTVTGTNDAPVIGVKTTDAGAVNEEDPLTASGQIVATDVDHDAVLSYSGSAKTELGSFEVNEETGAWTYTLGEHQELSANDSIQEKFTVKVTDDQGATVTKDVTVTVTGTNDAPVIGIKTTATGEANEDGLLKATGQIVATDADHDAVLSYSGSATTAIGSFDVDEKTGAWTYTLADHQELSAKDSIEETFTVKVSDDQGATVTKDVTVTVTGTNDIPVIGVKTTTTGEVNEDGPLTATGQIVATDADHDAVLSYSGSATTAIGSFEVDEKTGAWTYTLADHQELSSKDSIEQTFTVTVTDDQGATVKKDVTVTVTGTNDAPVIGIKTTATGEVNEDGPLKATGQIVATDADHDAVLSYSGSATTQLGSFEVNEDTGAWTYTLADHQELSAKDSIEQTFTVTVTDDQGAKVTKDVTVTVTGTNDAPVIGVKTTATAAVNEEEPLTASGQIMATDADHEAVLSYSGSATTKLGSFEVNADTGAWTYTLSDHQELSAKDSIEETFTVTVTDDQGATVTKDVTVTVTGTNDVPVIGVKTTATAAVNEEEPLTASGQIVASDVDHDAVLSYSGSATTSIGSFEVNADTGAWTYTLADHQELSAEDTIEQTFTVKVTDDQGATVTKDVTVTVTGTNDAPVIGVKTTATGAVNEEGPLTASGQIVATDVDHDAVLSYSGSATTAIGSFEVNADTGAWTYTLADHQELSAKDSIEETFTVKVSDDQGAEVTKEVTITVTGTNDAPVIGVKTTSTGEVNEDGPLTASGQIVATDADHDAVLSYSGSATTKLGSFEVNADTGAWTYTLGDHQELKENERIEETFTVTVTDDQGAKTTQAVTVTVTGTNDAAIITGTATATLEEADGVLKAGGTLSATDVDSDASFTALDGALGEKGYGRFSIGAGGTWTYETNEAHDWFEAGKEYTDTITVTTADGTPQVLTVTITGTNDAAVITASLGALDTTLDETDAVLSTGGTLTVEDVDNEFGFQPQTDVAGSGKYGTFSINAQGEWTYTADTAHNEFEAGKTYTDSLEVKSLDGTVATIKVTINGTNDAAVLGKPEVTLAETNEALSTKGQISITDVDSPQTFVAQSDVEGTYGRFSVDESGAWSFTANEAYDKLNVGDTLSESFTVESADGTTTSVTVTIEGSNDAAVITGTTQDDVLEIDTVLSAGGKLDASDVDNSANFVEQNEVAGSKGYGVFSIDSDGYWSYTADTAHNEFAPGVTYTDTLTVKTADGTEQVISVNILGTNDLPVVKAALDFEVSEDDASPTVNAFANASDVDEGTTLAVTDLPTELPAGVSFDASTGEFKLDLSHADYQQLKNGESTTVTVNYSVSDGIASVPTSVTWTVAGANDAPVVKAAEVVELTEDGTSPSTLDALAGASDVDKGDVLSVVFDTKDLPPGVVYNEATHSFTLDPAGAAFQSLGEGVSKTVTVSYAVSDGTTSSPASVSWTITGTNDAPVVSGTRSTLEAAVEDTSYTVTLEQLLAGFTDVDSSDTLVVTNLSFNHGSITDNGDGTYTVKPDLNYNGEGTLSYTVGDGHTTLDATLALNVTAVNDAPTTAAITLTAMDEDSGSRIITQADLLANAADVDNAKSDLQATGLSLAEGSKGTLVDNEDGTWTYTPAADDDTAVSFNYTITDGSGGESAGSATLDLTPVDDLSRISGDKAAKLVETNAALTAKGTLVATDIDGPVEKLDFVAQTDVDGSGQYGKFSINAQGEWTYTANSAHNEFKEGEVYTDSITVKATDGIEQTITVTLVGTNDAAVITGKTTSQMTETNVVLQTTGKLGVTDVDGKAEFQAQTGLEGNKGYGTLAITADGTWTYTSKTALDIFDSKTNYSETVTVKTADGTEQTITLNFRGTNDAPVVIATQETTPIIEDGNTSTVDGLAHASDVDKSAVLSVTDVPAKLPDGVSFDAATNSFTLDASHASYQSLGEGKTATVTVNYGVTDGIVSTATPASISWTVTGTNDKPVAKADTGAVTEDQALTGTVATNDSDVDDGAVLSYSLDEAVAGLTLKSDGSYSFDAGNPAYQHLKQDATQDVVAKYTVTDEHGATSQATLTITITGTNDKPVAQIDTDAVTEDQTLTGTVATSDSDVDDAAVLSYALEEPVAGLTFNADGSYSFDAGNAAYQHLGQGATQDVVAKYTVTDEHGAASQATLKITITGTNDKPVAQIDTGAATEDQTLTGTVATNDSDVDDDAVLTYTLDEDVAGLTLKSDGSYSFDASNTAYQHLKAGATQDVVAKYTVTDEHGATSQATLTFTLTGTNDKPVATVDTGAVIEDQTLTGTVATNDSDVDDGASLTYQLDADVAGLTLNADGSYSFDASNTAYQHLKQDATQEVVAKYTVTDEHGATSQATLTITITGTNDKPVAHIDTGTVTEDQTLTGTVATNDSDVDDDAVLTYTLDEDVAGLTLKSDGSYSFDAGNAAYQNLKQGATQDLVAKYTVTDEHGATRQATLTITITGTNDKPVARIDTGAATEDQTLAGTVATNDSDVDDDAVLTYTLDEDVAGLTLKSDGSYSFDASNAAYQHLKAGATQDVVAKYTVTDEHGATSQATLTFTLTGTNDKPVATVDTGAVIEDQTLTGTVATNDSDVDDGASLTYQLDADVAGLTLNADGSYSFDASNTAYQHLKQDATQEVVAKYTVTDEHGATRQATLTITITGTNDKPVARIDTGAVTEDQTLTGTVATNDSDVDDDAVLTYTLDEDVAGLTLKSDGSYSFDASNTAYQHLKAGATQDVVAKYTVTDEHGATSQATLTFTLTGTNDKPVATVDTGAVIEDQTLTGTVATNDSDVDDGASLTYQLDADVAGLTLNADGSYSFDASNTAYQHLKQDATQEVVAKYTVTDEHGATSQATLTITITGTNDTPVIDVTNTAKGDVNEDGPLTATGQIVASDVDKGAVLGYSGNATTTLGSFAVDSKTGKWTYTLADNQALAATDSITEKFTVTVTDDQGAKTTQEVVVTVTGSNDAPVISATTTAKGDVKEDGPLTATGQIVATDVDKGAVLGYSGNATTTLGSFEVDAATGKWTYTLADNQQLSASDSITEKFTVTVTDDKGATATQVVVVTVTGSNDAPVISSTTTAKGDVKEDGPLTANGQIVATDVDKGAVLGYSGNATTTLGSFEVDAATGKWTYTLADNQALAATDSITEKFTVTVTDDQGAKTTQEVVVTVTGSNDAPVISSTTTAKGDVKEDGPLTANGQIVATDVDKGAVLGYSGDATTTLGSFAVDAATGKWTYTLADNQALAATDSITEKFTVTVTDDQGAKTTQEVVVTVTGSNDTPVISTTTTAKGDVKEDGPLTATGQIVATDVDKGAVLGYSGNATTTLGSFEVDAATGKWTYTLADNQQLSASDSITEKFTVTVTDDQGAKTTQEVVVTVTGSNDTPVISTTTTAKGDVKEDGPLTATGQIVATDVDKGAVLGYSGNATTTLGSFEVDAATGKWTYTLADNQQLSATDSITEKFTVTVTDDQGATATQVVVVTVTGSNDTPVISSTTTAKGDVKEDGPLTANGQIVATDVDKGAVLGYSGDATTTLGSFAVDAATGKWTYTLADNQALAATDSITEKFTVTVTDDQGAKTTQEVVVTVTGSNDAPVISSTTTAKGDVKEDGPLTATGQIVATDVDKGAVLGYSGDATTTLGSFAVDAATGKWTYTLADNQALAATDSITEKFTVTVTDDKGASATQEVVVTVTGTNDTPVISTTTTAKGDVKEDGPLTATGQIVASDVDKGAVLGYSGNATTTLGSFVVDAENGKWTYTLSDNQALAATDSITEKFTVTVTDDKGAAATQEVVVTVTGTNDAAQLSAPTVTLVENDKALSTGGKITISDIDSPATFIAQTSAKGNYGRFSVDERGVWVYTADEAYDSLNTTGKVLTETFTVESADGTQTTVSVTITGSNDEAVITGTSRAALEENHVDDVLKTGGQLKATDVDSPATFVAQTDADGSGRYGKFSIDADGQWTYATTSGHDVFKPGQVYTDTLTVRTADGTAQVLSVTIKGAEDITGTATASVTESDAVFTASGKLDYSPSPFRDHEGPNGYTQDHPGQYGTFHLTPDGAWTYTANSAHNEFEGGKTYTDSFTATTKDGAQQVVKVTITGTDDKAVIGGVTTAALTETNAVLTTGGQLTAADPDSTPGFVAQTAVKGTAGYGSFSIDTTGQWSYTTTTAHDEFVADQVYTDTLEVKTTDGTTQMLTVAIKGTNDVPLIQSAAGGVDVVVGTRWMRPAMNNGDGSFTAGPQATALGGPKHDALLVDVNNDGNLDLLLANRDSATTISLGKGDGTFGNAEQLPGLYGGEHYGVAVGDVNRDGKLDVVSAQYTSNAAVQVNLGNGNGTFQAATNVPTGQGNQVGVALADLNKDGKLDIIASNWSSTGVTVNLGNGDGSFQAPQQFDTGVSSWDIAVGDVNRDGNLDLVGPAKSGGAAFVALGTGDGGFKPATLLPNGAASPYNSSSALADVNGDGNLDLIVGNDNGQVQVMMGKGDGTFQAGTVLNPASSDEFKDVKVADVNGDGKADILTAGVRGAFVNLGHGDGTFQERKQLVDASAGGLTLAVGDINNDAAPPSVTEDAAKSTVAGRLLIKDADTGQSSFQAQTAVPGQYGSFTLAADGNWRYALDNSKAATNALAAGQTVTDTFTVVSADGTGSHDVVVTVVGTDDKSVIGGVVSAALTESDAVLTATGQLTATDPDSKPSFVAQTAVKGTAGYGSFSIDAAGKWSYTTTTAQNEFVAGQVYTDTLTVATADGTTQALTVNITGTNDKPVVSGSVSTSLGEDSPPAPINLLANATDADKGDRLGTAGVSLQVTGGTWAPAVNYSVDNATGQLTLDPAQFNALGAGEQLNLTFSYDVVDSAGARTPATAVLTVIGSNDAPIVKAETTAALHNASNTAWAPILQQYGVWTTPNAHQQAAAQTLQVSRSFEAPTAGTYTFQLAIDNAGSVSLDGMELVANANYGTPTTKTVVLTAGRHDLDFVLTNMGTEANPAGMALTITGPNGAMVWNTRSELASAPGFNAYNEDAPLATLNLLANASDPDRTAGDLDTASVAVAVTSGTWAPTIQFGVDNETGRLTLDPGQFNALAAGQRLELSVNYNVVDAQGGSTPASTRFTVIGSNDAPVVKAVDPTPVTEDGATSTIGALAQATDPDTGATLSVTGLPVTLPDGVTYNAQTQSFTLDPSHAAFQSLAEGAKQTVTVTYQVSDGNTATNASVSWAITGTADGSVITGTSSAQLTETDAVLTTGGKLNSSELFVAQAATAGTGQYGKFSIDASGQWAYTTDSAHNQFVAGQTYTDTFTVKTASGVEQLLTVEILGSTEKATITAPGVLDIAYKQGTFIRTATNTDVDRYDGRIITTQVSSSYIQSADFDGDGKMDLLQVSGTGGVVNFSYGDGTFKADAVLAGSAVASGFYRRTGQVADVDGDGDVDIVLLSTNMAGTWTIQTHLNNGKGGFSNAPTSPNFVSPLASTTGSALTIADITGDGKVDILWSYNDSLVSMAVGNGDGTFKNSNYRMVDYSPAGINTTPRSHASAPALGDVNGDGYIDLVLSNSNLTGASAQAPIAEGAVVHFNRGNTNFQTGIFSIAENPVTAYVNTGIAAVHSHVRVADVNNDGKLDIVVSNNHVQGASVALGNGNGTFQAGLAVNTNSKTNSTTSGAVPTINNLQVVDMDGDGKLDIVTGDSAGVTVSYGRGDGSFADGVRIINTNDTAAASMTVGDFGGRRQDEGVMNEAPAYAYAIRDQTATGYLRITDPDAGEAKFQVQTGMVGQYGSLSIDATGKWVYTLDYTRPETTALGSTDQVVDTFTVYSMDGSDSHEVKVTITGAETATTLWGTAGADTRTGTPNSDVINTGAGNDRLVGGLGVDYLTGGTGADTFVFNTAPGVPDVIRDFKSAEGDKLELDLSVFSALKHNGQGVLTESIYFANSETPQTPNQHLVFDKATGLLSYDADGGNGNGQLLGIVKLDGVTSLTPDDLKLTGGNS